MHTPSGRVYNKLNNPPKIEGLDDITGEALVSREEDSREGLDKRLKTYLSETTWVFDCMKDTLYTVDAGKPMIEVSN